MKNFLIKYIVTLFLGAVVSLTGVFGVARAADSTTVLADLTIPTSLEDTSTIDQRLAQREATFKVQLSAAERTSLISKCTLSQSVLTDLRTKDRKAANIRFQTYSDLSEKLAFLVDNLSAQGVDASQLLASQNKFITNINTYLKDAETYKTAVDDTINVDCKSDPEGFEASLLEARQYRAILGPEVDAIKANLTGLRITLSDERQLLIKTPAVKPVVRSGVKQ